MWLTFTVYNNWWVCVKKATTLVHDFFCSWFFGPLLNNCNFSSNVATKLSKNRVLVKKTKYVNALCFLT